MTSYRIDPADLPVRVTLDVFDAAYHRRSGLTHMLTAPLPELIDALAAGPMDAGALLATLGIDDGAEARAALTARLDELAAIGIVTVSADGDADHA